MFGREQTSVFLYNKFRLLLQYLPVLRSFTRRKLQSLAPLLWSPQDNELSPVVPTPIAYKSNRHRQQCSQRYDRFPKCSVGGPTLTSANGIVFLQLLHSISNSDKCIFKPIPDGNISLRSVRSRKH